jgi:uncharacterized protein YjbJ (UPF0337 family)
METDTVRDQWQLIRGKAKEWWDKLTDEDLDVIDGNTDLLVSKLRERYGFSKDKAAQDVYVRIKELEQKSLKSRNAREAAERLNVLENHFLKGR